MVFVGLEVRQNTRAVRATAQNDLATASREYLLAQATSPELSAAYLAWTDDTETTPVQDHMVRVSANALMRNLENVFLQVQLGTISEGALGSFGMTAPVFRSRRFVEEWTGRRNFDPAFIAAFEAANGLPSVAQR
jgi:hypothetical protein